MKNSKLDRIMRGRSHLADRKGLTIVELMIVLGVVALLAGIAIPSYRNYQAKSRQAEAMTSLGNAYTLQSTFHTEYQHYTGCLGSIGYRSPQGVQYYTVGLPEDFNGMVNDGVLPPTCTPTCGLRRAFRTVASNTSLAPCTQGANETYFRANLSADSTAIATDHPSLPDSAEIMKNTFIIAASGRVGFNGIDVWSISHNKSLRNYGRLPNDAAAAAVLMEP